MITNLESRLKGRRNPQPDRGNPSGDSGVYEFRKSNLGVVFNSHQLADALRFLIALYESLIGSHDLDSAHFISRKEFVRIKEMCAEELVRAYGVKPSRLDLEFIQIAIKESERDPTSREQEWINGSRVIPNLRNVVKTAVGLEPEPADRRLLEVNSSLKPFHPFAIAYRLELSVIPRDHPKTVPEDELPREDAPQTPVGFLLRMVGQPEEKPKPPNTKPLAPEESLGYIRLRPVQHALWYETMKCCLASNEPCASNTLFCFSGIRGSKERRKREEEYDELPKFFARRADLGSKKVWTYKPGGAESLKQIYNKVLEDPELQIEFKERWREAVNEWRAMAKRIGAKEISSAVT